MYKLSNFFETMSVQSLTEAQQRKTLSAKKRKKQTIRNILATPFANYWPLVNLEDADPMERFLEENLTQVVEPKAKVSWNDLRRVPREKRKDFRLPRNKPLKNDMVFGINETSRLLEGGAASSVLVSGDVDPKLMVKHVLDMAVLKNVPILVLPHLKDILKVRAGIASVVLSIKTSPELAVNCKRIDEKIKELAVKYPPPSNHINSHRKQTEVSEVSIIEDIVDVSDDERALEKDVYLYRKTKDVRTFVPELSNLEQLVDVDGQMDFIKVDDVEPNKKQKCKYRKNNKTSYKSLTVKRITNNNARDMKKVNLLKQKK